LSLQAFEQRHEVPHGKDVVFHEAADVLDVLQAIVYRMACEFGSHRREPAHQIGFVVG
jgi:hypothetical protein